MKYSESDFVLAFASVFEIEDVAVFVRRMHVIVKAESLGEVSRGEKKLQRFEIPNHPIVTNFSHFVLAPVTIHHSLTYVGEAEKWTLSECETEAVGYHKLSD